MFTRFNRLFGLLAVVLTLGLAAAPARAQVFANATPITIRDVNTAVPYPSQINVAGAGTVSSITVTIHGLTHTFVDDVSILLVGPTGVKVLLYARCLGDTPISNATWTFADGGSPIATASGIYALSPCSTASLTAPAPAGPYAQLLSAFNGTNSTGVWSLYVTDSADGGTGTISGGWSISLNPPAASTAFTYQGQLRGPGGPITGTADVQFSLWNDPASAAVDNHLAGPLTFSGISLTNGLFTQPLDFGSIAGAGARWLEIAVRSPAGSGTFVKLSPRQPLSPAPEATAAHGLSGPFSVFPVVSVNASDFVGVGTTTPAAPLHLHEAGDADLRVDSTLGNAFLSLTTLNQRDWYLGVDRADAGKFKVGFNSTVLDNTPAFVIDPSNGHAGLSTDSPEQALSVGGTVQILTADPAAPNLLAFGVLGDFAGSSENTDAMGFYRINTASNASTLRLVLSDDAGANVDGFEIGNWHPYPSFFPSFRFESGGVAYKPGGGSWAVICDPRLKQDIKPLDNALDKLLSLHGYTFNYTPDAIQDHMGLAGPQIGLMADEVQRVFPDWVSHERGGYLAVSERGTTALTVEALRQLRAEKDAQIAELKKDNDELKARLARIEAILDEKAAQK